MTTVTDARGPELDSERDERRAPTAGSVSRLELDDAPYFQAAENRQWLLAVAVTMVVLLGSVLRLFAAMRLSPHVDEPSSILAAHAVAERGLPILPSGTAYLQGATLSYLLAPFVWLGGGDLENLELMRLVLVIAGTIAIALCYGFGRYVTGNAWVGAAMALLVAIDPVSVQWSGHVRMYAFLQALTVGLAWAFVHLLIKGWSRRSAIAVIALFWLAVFTHVGAALLFPAMALSVIVVCRQSLFRQRGLLGVLALCGMAPAVLLVLNRVLGTASVAAGEGPEGQPISFVGDNLIAPLARFRVSPGDWNWEALTYGSNLFWIVPGLIVAISTVIGARALLRPERHSLRPGTRTGFITLFCFYWLTVVAVGAFTVSPAERYLLHVHTLGYLFLAAMLFELTGRHWWRGTVGRVAACSAIVLVVVGIGGGLAWRLQHAIVHPNYDAAMAYAAAHHVPGQPVIVALPPVAYLALGENDRDDLYFLAGSQHRPRAERYTRWTDDGRLIDYWVGVDSIVTADELREILMENPDSLLVIDEHRLAADWAYQGEIEDLIRASTSVLYRAPGGALVLSPSEAAKVSGADADPGLTGGGQQPRRIGASQLTSGGRLTEFAVVYRTPGRDVEDWLPSGLLVEWPAITSPCRSSYASSRSGLSRRKKLLGLPSVLRSW